MSDEGFVTGETPKGTLSSPAHRVHEGCDFGEACGDMFALVPLTLYVRLESEGAVSRYAKLYLGDVEVQDGQVLAACSPSMQAFSLLEDFVRRVATR